MIWPFKKKEPEFKFSFKVNPGDVIIVKSDDRFSHAQVEAIKKQLAVLQEKLFLNIIILDGGLDIRVLSKDEARYIQPVVKPYNLSVALERKGEKPHPLSDSPDADNEDKNGSYTQ